MGWKEVVTPLPTGRLISRSFFKQKQAPVQMAMHYLNAIKRGNFRILTTMIKIIKIRFAFLYLFLISFLYHSHTIN